MASYIGRRKFLATLGGVAAWPLAARAQQAAVPVLGYLNLGGAPESDASRLTGLRRGLNQTGYVEGRNLLIEYRWANQVDRLSADPVQFGLVASLNRPGGNLTGFNAYSAEFGAKGLALLHELVPSAATIGFLANSNNPISELTTRDVAAAAPVIGLKVQILKASTDREIDAAFVSLVQAQTGALLVGGDAFFNSRIEYIVGLAARHAIPAMYQVPEFVVAGGLISYGTSLIEEYRQVGLYTGRILKGEKPGDLPVIQATKIGLIINFKTAKALGLQIPDRLLALADEVIE